MSVHSCSRRSPVLSSALATAKGPSVKRLGPGPDARSAGWGGEPRAARAGTSSLNRVAHSSRRGGFFAQAFGATPSATVARPAVALGPLYEVAYTVPGGTNGDSTLRPI